MKLAACSDEELAERIELLREIKKDVASGNITYLQGQMKCRIAFPLHGDREKHVAFSDRLQE